MNLRKTVAASATAILLAGGLAVVASPLAASAHSAEVTLKSVTCTPDGKNQVVDVLVQTSNVPGDTEGEVKVIEPGNFWLYEWAEHHANHGLPALAPNASFTYQLTVPANAKSVKTTVQIDWKDGYSHDPSATLTLPGNCTPPPPAIVEIPYPTLFGVEVCGVKNDTFYIDPAWVEKYGHLVNGPWIDGNYKLQNGLWVVDGSAQIKPENRKTHIWTGTGSTSASDFRRWQMYPGTQPFVYEDKGASNQTADPAAPCYVRPDVPVKDNLVTTAWEAPDCISKTVEGTTSTTSYSYEWNEETKAYDEKVTGPVFTPTSRPLSEDEAAACAPAHSGSITGDCEQVTVTLTNAEGDGRLTASFVLYVDGEFYDAYAVLAGETQTVTIEGDGKAHTYELRSGASQGDVLIDSLEVAECEVVPPTEPPVTPEEPVTPAAPAGPLPALMASAGPTAFGIDITTLAIGAALVLLVGGGAFVLGRRELKARAAQYETDVED